MSRMVLIRAALTAVFCSAFAVVVDAVMDMAGPAMVAGLAALSGFCGSLFASLVLRGRR